MTAATRAVRSPDSRIATLSDCRRRERIRAARGRDRLLPCLVPPYGIRDLLAVPWHVPSSPRDRDSGRESDYRHVGNDRDPCARSAQLATARNVIEVIQLTQAMRNGWVFGSCSALLLLVVTRPPPSAVGR